jgi:hypothetical protein
LEIGFVGDWRHEVLRLGVMRPFSTFNLNATSTSVPFRMAS